MRQTYIGTFQMRMNQSDVPFTRSPAIEMVTILPPHQPVEMEQKRRRQTLERAKMHHLSKQLQMRLQYARLKVEYGWQRQNLNEVENLYFHNSHLRSLRPTGGATKAQIANATSSTDRGGSLPALMAVDDPAGAHQSSPPSVPDRTSGSSPHMPRSLVVDNTGAASQPTTGIASEQSQTGDATPPPSIARPSSASQPDAASPPQNASMSKQIPPVQSAQANVASLPSSTLDLSDPAILAQLAQLQVQALGFSQRQPPIQGQSLPVSHPLPTATSTTVPTTSQPGSNDQTSASQFPIPSSQPFAFTSHPAFSFQSQFAMASSTTPQFHMLPTALSSAPASNVLSLHPPSSTQSSTVLPLFSTSSIFAPPPTPPIVPVTSAAQSPPAIGSSSMSSTATASTSIPTPTHGLTYDSFWSSHNSAAGTTRALYRTHTGFSASATPAGHIAMLTPGGHAAVMTADGVYVGGAVAKAGG